MPKVCQKGIPRHEDGSRDEKGYGLLAQKHAVGTFSERDPQYLDGTEPHACARYRRSPGRVLLWLNRSSGRRWFQLQ